MILISPCIEVPLPYVGIWIVEIICVADVEDSTGRGVVTGISEVGGTTADVG